MSLSNCTIKPLVFFNGTTGSVSEASWSEAGIYVDLLSPTLFNIFLERIRTDAIADHERNVNIGGRVIVNIRFADGIAEITREKNEFKRCDKVELSMFKLKLAD